MVMRDRQTGTLWQQSTGAAIYGPLSNCHLEPIGGVQETWSAWQQDYPTTAVAVEPANVARGLIFNLPYERMFALFARLRVTLPGLSARDIRLPSRADVVGARLAGEARAYPIETIRRHQVINDVLAGIPIALAINPARDGVRAFRRDTSGGALTLRASGAHLVDAGGTRRWHLNGQVASGDAETNLQPVETWRQWWLAWSEFHPGTSIYEPPSPDADTPAGIAAES
jgi:hypothetical protein